MLNRSPGQANRGYFAALDRKPCQNVGGQAVPAFGIVRITDTLTDGSLKVDRPNADSMDPTSLAVNGPSPIPVNGYGAVSRAWPLIVAYNTGATPAPGQTWGTASGSYLLTSGKGGFLVLGSPQQNRVQAGPAPPAPPAAFSGLAVGSGSANFSPLVALNSGTNGTVFMQPTNPSNFSNITPSGQVGCFTTDGTNVQLNTGVFLLWGQMFANFTNPVTLTDGAFQAFWHQSVNVVETHTLLNTDRSITVMNAHLTPDLVIQNSGGPLSLTIDWDNGTGVNFSLSEVTYAAVRLQP